MRVLAIDPGTIKMGYGFITSEPATEVVDYGVVTLSRYMAIEERLFQLFTHVGNMISVFSPTLWQWRNPSLGGETGSLSVRP